MRGLRYLWAAPASALGILLGLTTGARPAVRDGCLVFRSARGFAALHRRLGFGAITMGHVVVCQPDTTDATWRHELEHVRQWERYGPAMLLLYPLASMRGYRRNPFERAAARRAGRW
jgi:hypothetical protein